MAVRFPLRGADRRSRAALFSSTPDLSQGRCGGQRAWLRDDLVRPWRQYVNPTRVLDSLSNAAYSAALCQCCARPHCPFHIQAHFHLAHGDFFVSFCGKDSGGADDNLTVRCNTVWPIFFVLLCSGTGASWQSPAAKAARMKTATGIGFTQVMFLFGRVRAAALSVNTGKLFSFVDVEVWVRRCGTLGQDRGSSAACA
jgi:hypothetical protein